MNKFKSIMILVVIVLGLIAMGLAIYHKINLNMKSNINNNDVSLDIYNLSEADKSYRELELIFKRKPNDNHYEEILKGNQIDDFNYYIYSLSGEIGIYQNNEFIPLSDLLLDKKITVDEIIDKAENELDESNILYLNDGGSVEYHYPNFTMIKLNTILGNKDLYFVPKDKSLDDIEVVEHNDKNTNDK